MYNLNVNVTTSASSLAVMESSCTPKTPEILNTLIAMSNPFDTYPGSCGPIHANNQLHHNNNNLHHGRIPASPPEGEVFAHPGSMPPPSVQHTCSQLIKEGLKLTIQSKRKHSGGSDTSLSLGDAADFCNKLPKHSYPSPLGGGTGNGVGSSGDDEVSVSSPEALWLTAEDAERRRRRRERNKIAATKCRLKKRERTVNLVQESEILETQNHDLKSQIQDLETQRRQLMDMLSMHNQTCVKNIGANNSIAPPSVVNNNHYVTSIPAEHHQQQQQQQQHGHHQQQQQQTQMHQYTDPYQHYVNTPCTPCSPPQESPSPGFVHDVTYVQQTGMDSGCLA